MALSNLYQLENLVIGLLEGLNDKDSNVQESVSESLNTLGQKKTDFILKSTIQFMNKNAAKLSDSHKTSIFNTAEKIVKDNIDELQESLAIQWIELSSNEMIHMKSERDQFFALQSASSNLLVAIGKKYVKEVFNELQKNFNPGQLPHLFILTTMANLAEVNPFGVVPNLTGVLASMLPMLGMAKADVYKCAFATAMCKFSEAISFYISNKEKAPDKSIEKSYFSVQIYAAHEIFFNIWVKTNDSKLRQITIESIGNFVNLMANEKLESDIVKIMSGLLSLYKRHPDQFIVSQSLYLTISAVISSNVHISSMDTAFEPLIKELFAQIMNSLEQQLNKNTNPAALVSINKNQNEVLRCFAELAKRYSDRLLPLILQKFEQNNEKLRISGLIILKHLINSSEEQMGNKKQIVITGLRLLLNENNNRVKKYLIQVIIAMGYHGYLSLEGGQSMVEFIVKQTALPDDNPEKKTGMDDCTNDQLRSSAESILTLFSTTVENMHQILWPSLFEYFINIDYNRSLNQLCKNLAYISEIKRSTEAPDFIIDFSSHINLPKPYDILARMIITCGVPLNGKINRGLNTLQLMKNISPNISSSIVDLWNNVVPKLIANLEDKLNTSKYVQKSWEDLVMKLLSNSLDKINDEESICEIAKSFGKLIETLYMNSMDEKHFAYKCLGLVINKSSSKSTIDRHLDIIFNSVNHNHQYEREGCAISFGYAASNHLDIVLNKLETYSKNESKKSSGGLFANILKDSNKQGDSDQIKATIVLSYGYVTFFAPKDIAISRLEANILRSVCSYTTNNVKDLNLKQNILKSLDMITKCMHPDHLQKDFSFSYKPAILTQILNYITNDNNKLLENENKSMCFKICANIVKLNPKPSDADIFQLIKSSTDSFYPLQVPSGEDKKEKQAKPSEEADELEDDYGRLHGSQLYEQASNSLDDLLNTILNRNFTSNGLMTIFKHLEPWITSINDHERLRSIKSLSSILDNFSANFKPNEEIKETCLDCLGSILGRIVIRSTDPVIQIRHKTLDCTVSLIKSKLLYEASTNNTEETDKKISMLDTIKKRIIKTDSNILQSSVGEFAKVLCMEVPSGDQLIIFIERLIDGLLDVQSHCSSASCIFLNYFIKLRGGELKDQVDNLIRHLYTKLSLIQNPQAKIGTIRTIRAIFQQHMVDSLNVILTFPIPCNKEMVEICQSLCEDSQLVSDVIDHLLQIWNRCLPYEEKTNIKYASITPLIGTCILNEIFSNNSVSSTEKVFNDNFEKLFCALLIRVSSTLSNVMPFPKSKDEPVDPKKDDPKNSIKAAVLAEYKKLDPCKISIECFKNFIKCTQSYDLYEYYNAQNVWELLGQEKTNVEGCAILARGLCLHGDRFVKNIVYNLNTYLSAPYDCQKISATAFFAELINHQCAISLVELILNNLLTKLIDTCISVRTLCIRGLGNISSLGKDEVQKHSTTILSAMMAGLDDKDDFNDDITLESMNGLTKIIALIDENNVRPILINILLRIRPCFEKDKPTIRASAYELFGELARFGQGPSKEPYLEQIHSNFVSFILHLNDQDNNVKKSCKYVLKQVGPLIRSNNINELFQTHLIEDKSLHYGEFINDLSKLLVNEFPEKIGFYIMNSVSNFKSQWTEIRCNSVLLAGYLLGHLSKEQQALLSKEHISNALIKLLREDPSPLVRQKAAEAISLLNEF